MKEIDEVLTVAEVARELKCSKSHVYKMIRGDVLTVETIPVLKMGRRRLIRRSHLELWKQLNESDPRL